MLLCSDNSIYTGITTNPKRRTIQHNNKKGARSLYGKLPVKLVFIESHMNQISAAKREKEIKGLNHLKKIVLIKSGSKK
jgi:putative endonuclease